MSLLPRHHASSSAVYTTTASKLLGDSPLPPPCQSGGGPRHPSLMPPAQSDAPCSPSRSLISPPISPNAGRRASRPSKAEATAGDSHTTQTSKTHNTKARESRNMPHKAHANQRWKRGSNERAAHSGRRPPAPAHYSPLPCPFPAARWCWSRALGSALGAHGKARGAAGVQARRRRRSSTWRGTRLLKRRPCPRPRPRPRPRPHPRPRLVLRSSVRVRFGLERIVTELADLAVGGGRGRGRDGRLRTARIHSHLPEAGPAVTPRSGNLLGRRWRHRQVAVGRHLLGDRRRAVLRLAVGRVQPKAPSRGGKLAVTAAVTKMDPDPLGLHGAHMHGRGRPRRGRFRCRGRLRVCARRCWCWFRWRQWWWWQWWQR